MRTLAIVAAAGLLVAGFSIPALADKPADPGAGGQLVTEAVQFTKDAGSNLGQTVSEYVQSGGNIGEQVSSANRPPPHS